MPSVGIGWRSAHYGELLQTQPTLDFLEVHSENFFGAGGAALATLEQARARYPISLHGVGLGLGSTIGVDSWHLDQLARLVDRIDPVRVSDHACFARGHLGAREVHAADLLPIPFNRAALDVLCANVQQVQERLKRPLLIENLSAYIRFSSSDMDEAAFLNELARRTQCQLLVDINNLYVNALNARLTDNTVDPLQACTDWLERIDASAVGQLHIAGHMDCGDIVIDDHGSRACPQVWQLLGHARTRLGCVPTLIEWDTQIPALQVLLDEAAQARMVLTRGASVPPSQEVLV